MSMDWEKVWMTAERNEVSRYRRLTKKFLGIPYKGTHCKVFPARKFDTRQGDTIPARIHKYECRLRTKGDLSRLYVYIGDETEVPNFSHIRNNRGLARSRCLMYALLISDDKTLEIPATSVEIQYSGEIRQPSAVINCTQKAGIFVYDGLQDFSAVITFKDEDQRKAFTHEFPPNIAYDTNTAT